MLPLPQLMTFPFGFSSSVELDPHRPPRHHQGTCGGPTPRHRVPNQGHDPAVHQPGEQPHPSRDPCQHGPGQLGCPQAGQGGRPAR